jgi:hypothetical protein
MSDVNLLFAVTGAVAVIYGLLLLWSAKQAGKDLAQQQWLKSEEVTQSRFNTLQHMRYFLRPEHQFQRQQDARLCDVGYRCSSNRHGIHLKPSRLKRI